MYYHSCQCLPLRLCVPFSKVHCGTQLNGILLGPLRKSKSLWIKDALLVFKYPIYTGIWKFVFKAAEIRFIYKYIWIDSSVHNISLNGLCLQLAPGLACCCCWAGLELLLHQDLLLLLLHLDTGSGGKAVRGWSEQLMLQKIWPWSCRPTAFSSELQVLTCCYYSKYCLAVGHALWSSAPGQHH